jgi:hypothetical protein
MVESSNHSAPNGLHPAKSERASFPPRRLLDHIVSPYGLAFISYAFFLFACLIPPSIYSHYMMEPDLMFLDLPTILFYTLCVASFLAGVWLLNWLFPPTFGGRKLETRISRTLFLLIPLILGITAAVIADLYLIENFPTLLVSLMAQQGADVKDAIAFEVDGHLAFVPLLLIGILWWAFWRSHDFDLQGWRRWLVRSLLVLALLVVIASSALVLSRNTLMLALIGLAILHVTRKIGTGQIGSRFIFKNGAAIVICLSLLFFLFSYLRGVESWDEQINTLMGYTAASYNRLAGVVNGRIHYPFAGHGMYLSGVVAHSQFLPFSRLLESPDPLDVWNSEFGAVSRAGLDGSLIWSGAFGYIFSDLGWFSLPFLFLYGLLYGAAWNWIKRGRVIGIVLYPCFGFCALFWLGSNYLLDQPSEILSIVVIFLALYEVAFVRSATLTSINR